MGKIQAAFGAVRVAQLGDEGIRCGFEEGEAAGDYEQSEEKKAVATGEGSWPKEESTHSEKNEAGDETGFVSSAAHQKSGGHGQQKIAHVKRGLHQAGLESRDREGLHEMTDQDVVEIVGNAPEEKQDGDEDERDQMSCREEVR